RFECRWVSLEPQPNTSVFTNGVSETIHCPVAHGEGRFVAADSTTLARIEAAKLVALRYAGSWGLYPDNPNGSSNNIAGIANPSGTILGLMPHPEDHIIAAQHPRSHRGEHGGSGLSLFKNGVRYAEQI
ncbi:MAG TPA: phosphoribosylformylglycinamidine synthase, partial [Actinobacteria bacterium]|nr:phosphoribosylformylglycinamidine synthase [Actinomycetota bacterium]